MSLITNDLWLSNFNRTIGLTISPKEIKMEYIQNTIVGMIFDLESIQEIIYDIIQYHEYIAHNIEEKIITLKDQLSEIKGKEKMDKQINKVKKDVVKGKKGKALKDIKKLQKMDKKFDVKLDKCKIKH